VFFYVAVMTLLNWTEHSAPCNPTVRRDKARPNHSIDWWFDLWLHQFAAATFCEIRVPVYKN